MKIRTKTDYKKLVGTYGFFGAMIECDEENSLSHLGNLYTPDSLKDFWRQYNDEFDNGNRDSSLFNSFHLLSTVYKRMLDEKRDIERTFVLFTNFGVNDFRLISSYYDLESMLED